MTSRASIIQFLNMENCYKREVCKVNQYDRNTKLKNLHQKLKN